MQKKPVIAILPEIMEDSDFAKYSSRPWYAVREDYAAVISKFGGVPIMLTHMHDNIHDILSIIDGIVIAGGDGNIPPDLYGQEQQYDFIVNRPRAEFELPLLKEALSLNMPVMGICHGMQIINVALGGTLNQNILRDIDEALNHHRKDSREQTCHDILIDKNSMLYQMTQLERSSVNSSHSQSVNQLGKGLLVSATAPDGVIEAIESQEHNFVVGFEWHPEFLANPPLDEPLFRHFMQAASVQH